MVIKGLLKSRPPLSQFLLFISICLVSMFIIGSIGTVILSYITGMGFEKIADASKWDASDPVIPALIRGMQLVQFIALFLIPTYICSRLFSTDTQNYLGMKEPSVKLYFFVAAIVMILAIPFTEYLGLINKSIQLPSNVDDWVAQSESEADRTLTMILSKHTIKDLLLNIVFIAGLAAVGEELLFRGIAQRLLIKIFKSHWAGIIITAAIFSAIHMQFYGFIPRFALGVLLGAIYWYSGSLWVAMVAHFVYDAFLITMAYIKPELTESATTSVQPQQLLIAAIISFTAVFLLFSWMVKKTKTTYHEVYADDDKPTKNHPFDFDENTPE